MITYSASEKNPQYTAPLSREVSLNTESALCTSAEIAPLIEEDADCD